MIYATNECANEIQAVIKAINSAKMNYTIILDCIDSLKKTEYDKHDNVIIGLVPGHTGIDGNVMPDK